MYEDRSKLDILHLGECAYSDLSISSSALGQNMSLPILTLGEFYLALNYRLLYKCQLKLYIRIILFD